MIEVEARLERIGAPQPLRRVAAAAEDEQEFWQKALGPGERIWAGAVLGFPVERAIEAAGTAVLKVAETLPVKVEAIERAVLAAVAGEGPDACLEAAEACETLVKHGISGYRDTAGPMIAELAKAAALVARAGEGLVIAEARLEAQRMERARTAGAFVGIGPAAMLPPASGPAPLQPEKLPEDAAQGMLLFVVATAAEAADKAAFAYAGANATEETRRNAAAAIADVVWLTLAGE